MPIPKGELDFDRHERRRSGRVHCALTHCQFGALADISRDGCRVISKKPISLPDGKSVNLKIQAVGTKVLVSARPVSCRIRPDGRYDVGFQFFNLSEEAREELMDLARTAKDCIMYMPDQAA